MPARHESPGRGSWSRRVYRLLIRLYPRRFREEFGEPMALLFKDQWKAACQGGTRMTRFTFWVRLLADTCLAAAREHLAQIRSLLSQPLAKHFVQHPSLAFAATFLTMSVLLSATIFTVVSSLPPVYSSTARVTVGSQHGAVTGFDPYFMQTEFEKIQSRSVLNSVIAELDLNNWLARQKSPSEKVSAAEACRLLRAMISVRQSRNTSLLEIHVRTTDRAAAAQIANTIAEVYRRMNKDGAQRSVVEILDPAEPGLRPVSPNMPASLCLGWLLSAAIAGLVVWVIRLKQFGFKI